MSRVDEFELRIADWLEDGPIDAPESALEAAFEHARTHPRRAHSGAALRRRVMSQLRITQVAPRDRHTGWMLAAAAVVAVLIVGGAEIGTDLFGLFRGQSAIGGPSASPSTATVSGTVACTTTNQGSSAPLGDATVYTGRVERCTIANPSDPRIAGAIVQTVTRQQLPDTYSVIGTATLAAGGGTWDLRVIGSFQVPTARPGQETLPPDPPMLIESLIGNGSGAFDGLLLHGWIQGDRLTGTIRPPATGDALGTVTTSASAAPEWATVNGIQRLRDYVFGATLSSSDPTLTGAGTLTYSTDIAADGTGTVWATLSLDSSPAGHWQGELKGSLLSDGRQVITGRVTGSGDAAGRSFDLTLETTDPPQGWNLLALRVR